MAFVVERLGGLDHGQSQGNPTECSTFMPVSNLTDIGADLHLRKKVLLKGRTPDRQHGPAYSDWRLIGPIGPEPGCRPCH